MGAYEYGISLMPICLEYNDSNTCISFGFGNEGDNVVCESQSPVISFIDSNDLNDPPTYYSRYLNEFQQDPNLKVYEWVMKLDLEALADSNSNLLLTWDRSKLIEKENWTWKLVQGTDADGEVLVAGCLIHPGQSRHKKSDYFNFVLDKKQQRVKLYSTNAK